PPPDCGDGSVNAPGETCDPPGAVQPPSGNACRGNCTYCGDGMVDAGEQCDDGNANNTDACRNDCTPQPPVCCDGVINQAGETCEPPGSDPPPPGGNLCRLDCTYCGDGVTDGTEQC